MSDLSFTVQAVKLTGGTPKEELRDITQRLIALGNRKVTSKETEIKLCYVTVKYCSLLRYVFPH